MTPKYCSPALLVALDVELPVDRAVANEGSAAMVGCNNLVCSECGADVRHADSRSITSNYPPGIAVSADLYASREPGSSLLLDGRPLHRRSRAYFCRCNWASVDLGGIKHLGSIEAMWGCGGHGPGVGELRDRRIAEAQVASAGEMRDAHVAQRSEAPPIRVEDREDREEVSARAVRVAEARTLAGALVRVAMPVDPNTTMIRFAYAQGVNPEFATVSQLRDCLLASYPAADYFHAPVAGRNRDDTVPAWGWVIDLIRMRSDWWPGIGIALQHAVADGGELARTAFADLLAEFRDSLVLLPWTADVAAAMPDVRARGTGTGWGVPDLRLETIVRDQTKFVEHLKATNAACTLLDYGKGGRLIEGPLTNEAGLYDLLARSARAGQFPEGDKGPWSWLGFELRTHDEWIRSAFLRIATKIDRADDPPMLYALLDWLSEEQDLWRFEPLLAAWHADPRAWASTAAKTKPKGWRRTARSAHWPNVETLGDVASHALWRAKHQLATPAVVDLPPLFGTTIL